MSHAHLALLTLIAAAIGAPLMRNAVVCTLSILVLHYKIIAANAIPRCFEAMRTSSGGVIAPVSVQRQGGHCVYAIASAANYLHFQMETVGGASAWCRTPPECCRSVQIVVASDREQLVFCLHNLSMQAIDMRADGAKFEIRCAYADTHPGVRIAFTTSPLCSYNQFQCADASACYERRDICDGAERCADGSDETQCARRVCVNLYTADTYFQCDSGRCVALAAVQNGADDCGDGSDERHTGYDSYAVLAFFLLAFAFFGLVFRWWLYRRDVARLLDNLPEFPLPPFNPPEERAEVPPPRASQGQAEEICMAASSHKDGRQAHEAEDNATECKRNASGEIIVSEARRLSSQGAVALPVAASRKPRRMSERTIAAGAVRACHSIADLLRVRSAHSYFARPVNSVAPMDRTWASRVESPHGGDLRLSAMRGRVALSPHLNGLDDDSGGV